MASAPPPNDPIRAVPVPEYSREPIRVVVEQPRASWFSRIVKWGFLVLVILFVIGTYFGEGKQDIQERHHSLSRFAADKVAIISVEGTIIGSEGFVKDQIDQVRDDDGVKAVVVRVDSPGGTVTGSDYIHHHLKQLAAERNIPLVVSMGSMAASGGYYVAMAAGDRERIIFAEPTTWTGSIGVIIPHYNFTGLLEQIHVTDDSIASNPLKMMGSPTRAMPPQLKEEEQKILQGLVDSSFDGFKEIVLASRTALRDNKDLQDVVFTGRIFTAKQALENKLIDELGFIESAIDRAIELAGLDKDDVQVVEYHQPQGIMNELLFGPQSRPASFDLASLVELTVPKAYYLCTCMPALNLVAK